MGKSNSTNPELAAPVASGFFFPQRTTLGFDSRELTPCLVKKICLAGVKDRSEVEAAETLRLIGGVNVSAKTVQRVLHDVGDEYIDLRNCPPSRLSRTLVPRLPEDPPESVMVSVDGGRMMTRQPGQGPGVHGQAWRETQNGDFARLTPKAHDRDPHPELLECFRDGKHVAKIAESADLEVTEQALSELEALEATDLDATIIDVDEAPESETPALASSDIPTQASEDSPRDRKSNSQEEEDYRPKRIFRTCISSLCSSKEFGLRMSREARRRRFDEATTKAFIADGLAWNWSIWRTHFRDYTPILDFVHVVEYLFKAAKIPGLTEGESWEIYLHWATLCWQGKVTEALEEMSRRLQALGIDPSAKVNEQSPASKLHTAYRYLSNNVSRMDYGRYRQQGMLVTSASMESLVKQINQRVKGTEMFWNDSRTGGEAIVQLRSAYLCDDKRLEHYLDHRPGHPFVRRTTKLQPATAC